jgi:DNA modification methylase
VTKNFINKITYIDALEGLKQLDDNSIHCIVTSPSYYALRDYGTAKWIGGDANCAHSIKLGGYGKKSQKQVSNTGTQQYQYKNECKKCGAKRIDKQLGLENTPEEFVDNLCNYFDEAKRVLRDDGTCFVVLGDTYLGSGKGVWKNRTKANKESFQFKQKPKEILEGWRKPKQLALIPSRFAIEMQNRGWILRNKIIWNKPNCIPQSCIDRFTNCYEEILFFTKQSRYYFEQQFEPFSPNTDTWYRRELREGKQYNVKKPYKDNTPYATAKAQNPSDTKRRILESMKNSPGRNMRNVFTINTKPFPGSHFATFPIALIEPLIKAGTSDKGCCLICTAPYIKIRKHPGNPKGILGYKGIPNAETIGGGFDKPNLHTKNGIRMKKGHNPTQYNKSTFHGYKQNCNCKDSKIIPCIVLDFFMGSGTSAVVAKKLGRNFIGFDLNETYCKISEKRLNQLQLELKL